MSKSFVERGGLGFWAPDIDVLLFMRTALRMAGDRSGYPVPARAWEWQAEVEPRGMVELGLDELAPGELRALVSAVVRASLTGRDGVDVDSGALTTYWSQRLAVFCGLLERLTAASPEPVERAEFLRWVEAHPPPETP